MRHFRQNIFRMKNLNVFYEILNYETSRVANHGKTAELAVMSELFVNKNPKYDISANFIISNKKIKTFHFKIKYVMHA